MISGSRLVKNPDSKKILIEMRPIEKRLVLMSEVFRETRQTEREE